LYGTSSAKRTPPASSCSTVNFSLAALGFGFHFASIPRPRHR
jgi:hypothetical protein